MKRLVLPLVATLLIAPAAHAADDTAPALFKRGVELFKSGKVNAACKAFEMSDRLDDQPGTLFNMAACHEKQKRYFTAHEEFSRLAASMKAAGKADKAAIAKQRADDAAVHAPRLELVLPDSNNVTGIVLDGKVLPSDSWNQPVLVRTGAHHLTFTAKGKQTATADATASNDQTTRVPVPVLPDAKPEKHKMNAPPGSTKPGPPPGPPHSGKTAPAAPHDHASGGWTEQKTIGVAFAGAGVVVLGVGGAFGLRALSQKSDADKACGNSSGACATATQTRDAKARIHDAQTSATISTVTMTAGALGVVVGAYLFFTGNRSTEARTAKGVHFVPSGPGDAGFSVVGAF